MNKHGSDQVLCLQVTLLNIVVDLFHLIARKICKDASDNCRKYVNADAQACSNDEFVWHTCPKTCGYCKQIEGNHMGFFLELYCIQLECKLKTGPIKKKINCYVDYK